MMYLKDVTTLQYNMEKCTGCRLCAEVCPHGVFIMQNRKAQITDKDRCIECGACQTNCESGAITVQSGVGCSAALIYSIFTGKEAQCGTGSSGASCC